MSINIKKVDRSEIILFGNFSRRESIEAFERVRKGRHASMKWHYDSVADETKILLLPCRVASVGMEDYVGSIYGAKRIISIVGDIPEFVDFYDGYWKSIQLRSRKDKSDARYVNMGLPTRYTDIGDGKVYTFVELLASTKCKHGHEVSALDDATDKVCESLRLIASDINSNLMASAKIIEDLSLDLAEELSRLADDETQKRYEASRLRRFNNDELVPSD